LRVLLELRPALDGHAGIPQETRLLFRELLGLPQVQATGLIQSSNRVIARGLRPHEMGADASHAVDRLSRVVTSLQQSSKPSRAEQASALLQLSLRPAAMLLQTLLGRRVPLTHFDAAHFRDFVWRAMFAKTLPPQDIGLIAGASYRVLQVPWAAMHAAALVAGRLGHALYPRLDTRDFDIVVAETPFPGRVAAPTKLVVRYHDAIPLFMPHTISDRAFHRASHFSALRRNVRDGAWFACVSEATRKDLLSVFPEVEARAATVHNIVSESYHLEHRDAALVPEIVHSRRLRLPRWLGVEDRPQLFQGPYLLMVSTIEPRKNHLTLLGAWEQLRASGHADLRLVFVGSLGWESRPILRKLRPWLQNRSLSMLAEVPSPELRLLYRHAAVTVCPSFGEGFDFSGVEAMRSGGIVVASDIPVHREIYDDAALFCNAYSQEEMARTLGHVLSAQALAERERLRARGQQVAERYTLHAVLPRWQSFLERVQQAPR
jgi:glycosyltransferase involved in cell wall biosynthesis